MQMVISRSRALFDDVSNCVYNVLLVHHCVYVLILYMDILHLYRSRSFRPDHNQACYPDGSALQLIPTLIVNLLSGCSVGHFRLTSYSLLLLVL